MKEVGWNVDWYQLTQAEVERKLHVLTNKGLSEKQIEQRRKKFGLNALVESNKQSLVMLFVKQFQDFMVLILLAATLIAGLLGEYIDAIAIMAIVLLNGCIGFFQEQKAEKSLEKLKELSAPLARVRRNNTWQTIQAEEVVVGDVVKIKTGDRIPADIRIVSTNGMETEESTLTGESIPIPKETQAIKSEKKSIQDQYNIGFKGTLVSKGNGTGIVIHTGMDTAIGNIASLINVTERKMTPLELKLMELGKILIFVVFLLTVLTVGIGVYHGQPLYDMVLAGVSLAVAVIPEGLPAIVTVALSLGVQRMIKRKAIVRHLSAVETLGCATVICSDKTGTITENKMTVQEMFVNNQDIHVTGASDKDIGELYHDGRQIEQTPPYLESLALYGALCNDATLYVKKGRYIVEGDPTDGALLIVARKLGIPHDVKEQYKVIKEYPFDSLRKKMGVVLEDIDGRRFLIVKGAPEKLIPTCTTHIIHGERKYLTDKAPLERKLNEMASHALRTIAVAVKPLKKTESLNEALLEQSLTFVGLYGLKDPPRPEVSQAVAECAAAGVSTVMITGDHKQTALAIAAEIGMLQDRSVVLDSDQLSTLTTEELAEQIDEVAVFARVTPEDKLKIVQAYQLAGHIVAMTGDGVNDAPAIKASNIGISMGMTGTDVTKEASSLILLDDNFHTIKEAIREGRNIYENIRKFIRYLLASNVGEIFVMLAAMMLALPLPLVPVQILWVNLVTDGLPAMALGLDPPERNVMRQRPRNQQEGIFARGLGTKIITRGIMIGIVSLIAFITVYDQQADNLQYARTVAFTTLVLAQLIHVFDCRSDQGIFSRNPFSNMYLLGAVLSSLILLIIAIYLEPLQPIFHTMPLGLMDWIFIIALSALPTILFGVSKRNK